MKYNYKTGYIDILSAGPPRFVTTYTQTMIEIALYQPDIAANTATILRTAACLGLPVHIIEPAGFAWSTQSFRRAGMDYVDSVRLSRHDSWDIFQDYAKDRRVVLMTTKAADFYTQFTFVEGDIVLMGRESAGVPDHVHECADARITIPMAKDMRSLNVAIATGMVCGEALRQLRGF